LKTDKVFSFFGGGSGSSEEDSSKQQESDGQGGNASTEDESTTEKFEGDSSAAKESTTDTTGESTDKSTKQNAEKAEKTVEEASKAANSTQQQQIPLVVDVLAAPDGFSSLSAESKTSIVERMKRMDLEDDLKRQRDEARNSLEAFVYSSQDALNTADIRRVSTEQERTALSEALSTASEWLNDEGDSPDIPTADFKSRLAELKKLRTPLDLRLAESTKRPKAVEILSAVLEESKKYLFDHFSNLSADSRLLTEADTLRLGESIEKSDKWLSEKIAAQEKLPVTADPVLLSVDLVQRTQELERELAALKNRRRQLAAAKAAAEAAAKSSAAAAAASAAANSTDPASAAKTTTATVESSATVAAETSKPAATGETDSADQRPATPEATAVQPTANPYHEEL
jgi:hypoxia up-regulated 1